MKKTTHRPQVNRPAKLKTNKKTLLDGYCQVNVLVAIKKHIPL